MFKRKVKPGRTTLRVNNTYEGESIEHKINRIVNNKEPIKDGAPIQYTDRKDGVRPEFDIRTDRFEIAVEAMDKVSKTHLANRENRLKIVKDEDAKGTENKSDKGGKSDETSGNNEGKAKPSL